MESGHKAAIQTIGRDRRLTPDLASAGPNHSPGTRIRYPEGSLAEDNLVRLPKLLAPLSCAGGRRLPVVHSEPGCPHELRRSARHTGHQPAVAARGGLQTELAPAARTILRQPLTQDVRNRPSAYGIASSPSALRWWRLPDPARAESAEREESRPARLHGKFCRRQTLGYARRSEHDAADSGNPHPAPASSRGARHELHAVHRIQRRLGQAPRGLLHLSAHARPVAHLQLHCDTVCHGLVASKKVQHLADRLT